MIDTITLTLYGKQMTVNPNRDSGSVVLKGTAQYQPYSSTAKGNGFVFQNSKRIKLPSKEDTLNCKYHIQLDDSHPLNRQPRVTITLSIPKFLYGSSLYELDPSIENNRIFVNKLHHELIESIPGLTVQELQDATVARLDICRNIVLPKEKTNLNWFISVLSTIKPNERFKMKRNVYENGKREGSGVNFYNTLQAIKFYNKLEEILNLQNPILGETMLIKALEKYPNFNILRFEVSFQNYAAVKSHLQKRIEKGIMPTLNDVWNKDLLQKILIEKVILCSKGNINLFNATVGPSNAVYIQHLLNNGCTLNGAGRIFMFQKLTDELGYTGVRQALANYIPKRTISYNYKILREFDVPSEQSDASSIAVIWNQIHKQIENFEPITRENWKQKLQ